MFRLAACVRVVRYASTALLSDCKCMHCSAVGGRACAPLTRGLRLLSPVRNDVPQLECSDVIDITKVRKEGSAIDS